MKHELQGIREANRDLQRRWITSQQELINLHASNAASSHLLHVRRTEQVVVEHRQTRLAQK